MLEKLASVSLDTWIQATGTLFGALIGALVAGLITIKVAKTSFNLQKNDIERTKIDYLKKFAIPILTDVYANINVLHLDIKNDDGLKLEETFKVIELDLQNMDSVNLEMLPLEAVVGFLSFRKNTKEAMMKLNVLKLRIDRDAEREFKALYNSLLKDLKKIEKTIS